jgi:Uma2 family endonuclease
MSAAAVGAHMPADLTLEDLAAMAVADEHGHRYEMSPEGVLSIMPPAGVEHAMLASRLLVWFVVHGWTPEQVLQNCGLRITTADGAGGRVPDLTIWSEPPKAGDIWATVDGLVLAVEIMSRGSEAIDQVIKEAEYAKAGVKRYWIVSRDAAHTVTRWRLVDGAYQPAGDPQPLTWLLTTTPDEHLR